MNKNSILSAFSILLTIALTHQCWASEQDKFPSEYADEYSEFFTGYMTLSTDTLNNFDQWTKSKVNQGDRNWINDCNTIKKILENAYRDALEEYDSLPDPVLDWYREEAKAWDNVLSIGADLIRLHDSILETTENVARYQQEAEKTYGRVKSAAPVLQKALEQMFDLPSLPDGVNPEIESTYEGEVKGAAQKMTSLLTQFKQDAEMLMSAIDRENYPARLKTLENKNIDPDQNGEFVKHEKIWESNMRSVLDDFLHRREQYAKTARPVYEGQALGGFSYLKSAGLQVSEHVSKLYYDLVAKHRLLASRAAPPQASIESVKIRDFREPGEMQNIEVVVKNTGDVPLQPGEWIVRCDIDKHPKHYRPASGDFDCGSLELRTSLLPGKTHTFRYRADAPEGTGDWELQWKLMHEQKPVSTATKSFRIMGEVNARFALVKINGRDVTNKRVIKPDERMEVRLTIENTGTEILFRNRCRFIGKLKKQINGSEKWNSFRFDRALNKDIAPGERFEFTHKVEAPGAEGEWEVEFEFQANRRTLIKVSKVVDAKG